MVADLANMKRTWHRGHQAAAQDQAVRVCVCACTHERLGRRTLGLPSIRDSCLQGPAAAGAALSLLPGAGVQPVSLRGQRLPLSQVRAAGQDFPPPCCSQDG